VDEAMTDEADLGEVAKRASTVGHDALSD